MIKESFILFTEFRESFNELSNEEAGILIKAIFDYTTTGIEPKLDKLLKLVFIPIKQCIDRNSQNYETYNSFNKIQSILPDNFIRCHKSYIANTENISNINTHSNKINFNNNVISKGNLKYGKK